MFRDTILHIQPPVTGLSELVIAFHAPTRMPSVATFQVQTFSQVMEFTLRALREQPAMLVLVETPGCGRDLIEELRRHGFAVVAIEPAHLNRT